METAILQRIDNSNLFRLLNPLSYTFDGIKWTVQPGFLTDGASIPSFFHSLVGPPVGGEYTEAAVFHDALCRSGWVKVRDADEMMRRAMILHGTPENIVNPIMLGLTVSRLWRRRVKPDPQAPRYLKREAIIF